MRCVTSFLLILSFERVYSFFPSRLSSVDIGDGTWTHADITETGILKAVAAYFEANPRPNTTLAAGDLTQMEDMTTRKLFQAYYGGGVSESRFQDAINSITSANNQVNLNHLGTAAWHCNGETIREANMKMTNLREQAILVLSQNNIDFDMARILIGQFLHIMQMFYSNTNWVEFNGAVPYYSLGIQNKPLLGQAPLAMDTCRSCGEQLDIKCEKNMIVNGFILTSGYRSGQDVTKPYKDPSVFRTGKCSHGGPWDESSSSVAALGGINKDSTLESLSPHSHLHQLAAQAAIEHTTYFFGDEEYGIRGIIGTKKFNELLQLKSGTSLVFVIDYTGSMSNDIAGVKSVTRDIILSKIGTLEEPANFIFSLFNDPVSLNMIYTTADGNDALRYLDEISVSGGGDCPEYAMSGLINALTICNYNSEIYTFTDASAKDAQLGVTVLSLAVLKGAELEFVLTGDCSRRKRSTGGDNRTQRIKRSTKGMDLYRRLATATGGSVYVTSKAGIAKVAEIIKESVKTSSVTVVKTSLPASDKNVTFPVDQTIRQATIKIIALDRTTPVYKLYTPDNTEATSNVTVSDLGDGILLVKIENPSTGVWRLARQGSNTLEVEVTGQSTLDITVTFVKLDPNSGFEYEISGRPIAGENATVILGIPSSDDVGTVDEVILTDTEGVELARHGGLIQLASRTDSLIYRTTFSLPVKAFQIAVEGSDMEGHQFLRLRSRKIVPVSIDLTIFPLNGRLYINEQVALPFLVVNKGDAASNVTVTVKDDQNFASTNRSVEYMLQPGQNATGEFTLQAGPVAGLISTVTVSASASAATGDEFQFGVVIVPTEERVVREEDDTAPSCNVTTVTGTCDVTMLDPCVCSQYMWSGTAEIQDDGFGLYQVTSSFNTTGSFQHDNFTLGCNDTISATITSDCCKTLVYIIAVDLASNTGQCVFDLAPGLAKPFHSCKPTNQPPDAWSSKRVIIVAVVGVAGLFCLITVVIVVIRCRRRKKTLSLED
ncbi:von Willebrand factor A domain-containing protein 7-like isoform X2 [Haliotis asinina]|uniref:von Willebrand factor A domain-containing protein 7-like isoform X2 n=1 Tax=Haliotis asinina TaxID=109174 RepID=UPI0035320B9E